MTVRLLVGDALTRLRELPDASVQACVTSPPYYGLRAYGTNPQVWGGDPACAHEWGEAARVGAKHPPTSASTTLTRHGDDGRSPYLDSVFRAETVSAYCTRCGAWRGELGSEPTPEQFVANLVAVFREVRRVLHPSGVCIVNLGDSYAGSGKGPTGHNGIGDQAGRQGFTGRSAKSTLTRRTDGTQKRQAAVLGGGKAVAGYKAKDLMQMPFKVAEALRADGWFLRSVMPWLKRAAMPESVTDRPSNALEWLFLFSRQVKYFWDAEAIRQQATDYTPHTTGRARNVGGRTDGYTQPIGNVGDPQNGHSFRNSDPWFISLDAAIADARADLARLEAMRATGGALLDDDGLPLAVDINPAAYKEAHFATYPPALVAPFVKAGTSERGCCPRCLAPWTRVVERTPNGGWTARYLAEAERGQSPHGLMGAATRGRRATGADFAVPGVTLGWKPSCACNAGEPRPCTILDPFAGSGTTLLVADRLGRDAIGIELSPEYARMAEARIAGDAPLLNGLAEFEPEAIEDKQGALGKRTYTGFNARWKAKQDGMAEVETTAGDYAPIGLFGEAAS